MYWLFFCLIRSFRSPTSSSRQLILLDQVRPVCLSVCLSLYPTHTHFNSFRQWHHHLSDWPVSPSGNWILERSLDGVTFDPWQFYAISDSECLSHYNVTPRLGPPTYKRDTEVICTSYYSRLNPLEHGEVRQAVCFTVLSLSIRFYPLPKQKVTYKQ